MSTAVLRSSGAASSEDRYSHKYIIAATVTMAAMLELIDTSLVNVAIPHMLGHLGATLDEIAWVSTAYIIANVIVIPMSGWLSAYFGRKRYFTGSIALFTVASFFCGSSSSLLGLIFWRVIQGIGGGALLSTAQATLYESFPPEEAGTGMAIFGVGVMVGPTLGPTLGGWITDNYSWPWIFYINVPLGIIAAILTVTYVNDAEHQERADTIDYLGIILLTLCVGSLQWMLERGERYDWWDSRFVTLLGVTALLSGITLIWHELTTDEPVINFRILKSRQLSAGVTFGLLLGFALYGSVFILPGAIASAVTMAVVGRNAMRLDARYTVVVGAFLFFWSMLKMSHLTSASGQYDLFWPLILRGVALGLIFVPLTNATMADLKVKDLAQGTGMFNLMRQLGGSLGIAVMATMLAHFISVEKTMLVEHVGANDPETLSRLSLLTRGLISRGMNPITAQQQALAILDRQVSVQSSMLAFSKIYLYSGLVLIGALPLLLLFRTGRARGSMGPVH